MWTLTGSLNGGQGRREHTATLLPSGQVLVAGGFDYNGPPSLSSAELYNRETEIWTATGSMTVARDFFTATLLHTGKVLVAGGTVFALRSAELYDPTTGIWTATGRPRQWTHKLHGDAAALGQGVGGGWKGWEQWQRL